MSLFQIFFGRFNFFSLFQNIADSTYSYFLTILNSHPSSWNWLYEAILIGREDSLKSQPELQSFIVVGLYHMMVGTGTHVLALEKVLEFVLFFIPHKPRKFVILSALIFFCFMNRLKPPCVRAVLGRAVFFKKTSGELLNIDAQMVITFCCLLLQPSWSISLSFQFSCAATLALAMAASFHKQKISLPHKILSAGLCTLVTFPLVLGIQPCVSWLTIPTNTIALPLFEGVFMPLTLLNVFVRPFSVFTEKIFILVFGISHFLAQFEKPLLCMDERKMKWWGLIYLSIVYLSWRFALPWFFRRRFWRNQTSSK